MTPWQCVIHYNFGMTTRTFKNVKIFIVIPLKTPYVSHSDVRTHIRYGRIGDRPPEAKALDLHSHGELMPAPKA
jgi:hypothetical protein